MRVVPLIEPRGRPRRPALHGSAVPAFPGNRRGGPSTGSGEGGVRRWRARVLRYPLPPGCPREYRRPSFDRFMGPGTPSGIRIRSVESAHRVDDLEAALIFSRTMLVLVDFLTGPALGRTHYLASLHGGQGPQAPAARPFSWIPTGGMPWSNRRSPVANRDIAWTSKARLGFVERGHRPPGAPGPPPPAPFPRRLARQGGANNPAFGGTCRAGAPPGPARRQARPPSPPPRLHLRGPPTNPYAAI